MGREEFGDFLLELPERRFRDQYEATPTIVSEITNSLGYKSDCLFYDVSFGESDNQYADAAVASQITARPYVVFRVQAQRIILNDNGDTFIKELVQNFQSNHGLIITPQELYYSDGSSVEIISLDLLSNVVIDELYDDLKAPQSLPEWPLSEFYENKNLESEVEGLKSDTPDPTFAPYTSDFDRTTYEFLLRQVKEASTNKQKKDSLEDLAALMFNSITCLSVRSRNIRTATGEIDLIVQYTSIDEQTIFDEYGRYILVECKNWSRSIGSDEVRKFYNKLQESKTQLGVIFCREGITGENHGKDAFRVIDDAFQKDGISVIIIDERDLNSHKAYFSFYTTLQYKLFNRRFRRS